ncbi:aspartyl protease-like protein [Aphelenchoides avenae]|nr:aspartyl protease-like protein [Aphelenchus avenae]
MRDGVDSPDLPGGTITYGGVDTNNCDSKVTYIPAADDDPSELPLARISFGAFEEKSAKWTATLSFDGTALKGPADVVDGLAKAIGATKDKYDFYNIACNATVPSLFLTFGDQHLEIPPSELIKPLDAMNPNCYLSVSGAYSDFYVGAALAKKNCLVFDYDNVKFGFSANLFGLAKS